MNKIVFEHYGDNTLVYLYYAYLSDFHTEPKSIEDLFERETFKNVQAEMEKKVRQMYDKG